MSNLYALLIGVDFYLPNMLPGGGSYPCLSGCTRDISLVEDFLQHRLGMKDDCILKLTSTNTGGTEPPEPPNLLPTYENMIAAFKKLNDTAQPGDLVYVHYSGHGGRAKTQYPDLKGADGLDEALVPMDIANSEARYLRDVELAHILKTMVDKGLIVTIVLDSCHSGGATRGNGGATVRGINAIDTTVRQKQSLVAPDGELIETWKSLSGGATRNVKLGSGWLLEPKGYVFLGACRASESAYEYKFDGSENNGALTYWLIDSLKQVGPGVTYKQLHDRILAKVHSQFEQQTPQLQGEGNRVVFGSDQIQSPYAVDVMQIDQANQRILLGAGQAQGMRKGVLFVIYPPNITDFSQVDLRLALAEITELGATDSWANIVKQFRTDTIEQGYQAVLFDPGANRLRRMVRLLKRDGEPPGNDRDGALKEVERSLEQSGSGFVKLAGEGEPADYQVVINAANEYEIWDSAGKPISNLHPAIRIDDQKAQDRLVQRLVHLTKYRNVLELDNHDAMSPLAHKLVFELAGKQSDFDPADKPEPEPFSDPGDTPTLQEGEWTFLCVKNKSQKILNITALDLQPDWGISQIYPSGAGYFEPLDPGQEVLLPLQASLPPGYAEGTDVIKVFATVGTTNFRWLELPALDQEPRRSAMTRGGPAGPLEELLAQVTAEEPKTRNLNTAVFPSWEWAAGQVEVRVKRL
jgi:hypothetical protein